MSCSYILTTIQYMKTPLYFMITRALETMQRVTEQRVRRYCQASSEMERVLTAQQTTLFLREIALCSMWTHLLPFQFGQSSGPELHFPHSFQNAKGFHLLISGIFMGV